MYCTPWTYLPMFFLFSLFSLQFNVYAEEAVTPKKIGVVNIEDTSKVNKEVYSLVSLINDIEHDVDWETEMPIWKSEAILVPKKCEDYEKLYSLVKTRKKLYFILKKLSVGGKSWSNQWKDPSWYENKSYYKFLFNRDTQFISNVFSKYRSVFEDAIKIESIKTEDWKLFIEELLDFHARIKATKNWKDKFDKLLKSRANLGVASHFHEIGFPRNKNSCYARGGMFGGNYIVGYDLGTEGWFYSFWVRRYQEGNIENIKSILEWTISYLSDNFYTPKTIKQRLSRLESTVIFEKHMADKKPATYVKALSLSSADMLESMEICESVIKTKSSGSEVEQCYLLLGKLKNKHARNATPLYLSAYPDEFSYNEISGNLYNGFHFKKLIDDFPQSSYRVDAEYELTKVYKGGECEGHTDCYINWELSMVKPFLTNYPNSIHTVEAIERINESFLNSLSFVDDIHKKTFSYSPSAVKALLEEYQTIVSKLPNEAKMVAYRVISTLWINFGDTARANEIEKIINKTND